MGKQRHTGKHCQDKMIKKKIIIMQEKFCLAWLVGCWPLGDWIPERTTLAAGLFMWLLSILITASQVGPHWSVHPLSLAAGLCYVDPGARWSNDVTKVVVHPGLVHLASSSPKTLRDHSFSHSIRMDEFGLPGSLASASPQGERANSTPRPESNWPRLSARQ